MGLTFSYKLVDSDESRKIYEKMLAEDAAKFAQWRQAKPARQTLPIDASYAMWWFQHGPTAFATGTDAVRYKRELLQTVKTAEQGNAE